jgi:regulator of protease activity HflC (stomatin/prohibitin superfamily)
MIIPVIDSLSRFVDQRVRVTAVNAESALTRDTVPVNVDAIVFWVVWSAEKCILEVEDFQRSIAMSTDGAPDRTPRTRPDDHRARDSWPGT